MLNVTLINNNRPLASFKNNLQVLDTLIKSFDPKTYTKVVVTTTTEPDAQVVFENSKISYEFDLRTELINFINGLNALIYYNTDNSNYDINNLKYFVLELEKEVINFKNKKSLKNIEQNKDSLFTSLRTLDVIINSIIEEVKTLCNTSQCSEQLTRELSRYNNNKVEIFNNCYYNTNDLFEINGYDFGCIKECANKSIDFGSIQESIDKKVDYGFIK